LFIYKIIFLFHIIFTKLTCLDLRPKFIRAIYGFRNNINNTLNQKQHIKNHINNINKALDQYKIDADKRALWESFRLDFLNDNNIDIEKRKDLLMFHINSTSTYSNIIFENMMECSLRASNVLIFITANNKSMSCEDYKCIKVFLKKTYFLNYICPDMYFKRSGISIKDESNNHFMFCLCFQLLYLNNISKTTLLNKYFFKYFELKFSSDGFLKEGSTFYSYSISNAVAKMLFLLNDSNIDIINYNNLFKSICSINDIDLDLININFGDKDGTILMPSLDDNNHFLQYCINLTKGSDFDLSNNIHLIKVNDLKIIVNSRKIYQYGTLGHYHDDYGHFNLYSKNQVIFDPGTLSYTDNNYRFDSSYFHNAPTINNSNSMLRKANFEKNFNSQDSKIVTDKYISILRSNYFGSWSRKFALSEALIEDNFNFNKSPIINIFMSLKPKVYSHEGMVNIFHIDDIQVEITCNHFFTYNVQESIMAPSYGAPSKAYILSMNFKKNTNNQLKWRIKCLN
tara:strand:- start:32 stop:1567 length:1536 start_codon:yes stop_codon:yes gene_type:complete